MELLVLHFNLPYHMVMAELAFDEGQILQSKGQCQMIPHRLPRPTQLTRIRHNINLLFNLLPSLLLVRLRRSVLPLSLLFLRQRLGWQQLGPSGGVWD